MDNTTDNSPSSSPQESDPLLQAISPLHASSEQALNDDEDRRDSYFTSENEQSYRAPSAPLLSPPVKEDPETRVQAQENIRRTQAITPLGQ